MQQTPHHSPEAAAGADAIARVRPRWRGVSHQYAFFAAIVAGLPLVLSAPTSRATFAAGVYVASLAGLLGTSALYHRIMWGPRARFWMGRVDISMIFVLIAGSYTPIVLLALQPARADKAFWLVWAAAGASIAMNIVFSKVSKSLSSIMFVVVSSVGAIYLLPEIIATLGIAGISMFAAGGVLYILGALVYGLQRPDPLPRTFGYHEIFHALVVAAATIHFVAIAAYVLPA